MLPAVRIATLTKGVPPSIVVDGVTYIRIRVGDGGPHLDILISSQPLYGRTAS